MTRASLLALSCALSLSTVALSSGAFAQTPPCGGLTTLKQSEKLGTLQLRVGIQRPCGEVKGDVLFFHGFADRIDNHGPLFAAFNSRGLRVIAFDLPSHGETSGIGNHLDLYDFGDIENLAVSVEESTREDKNRPLILAGWSTGGLLAIRSVQSEKWIDRQVSGLVLLAPGVAVRPLVGENGVVTQATLTRNPTPPHMGPISPTSPLLHPAFATHLLANAGLAWICNLPESLPFLTVVGGEDEDRYVISSKVKDWTEKQRNGESRRAGLECAGAYHELDNEPSPVGRDVREAAASFAAAIVNGTTDAWSAQATGCAAF